MDMKNRLQLLMADKEIISAKLADVVGVQPSAISHILSGRNKPGFDLLANLLQEYKNVNPRWLMLGEGDMYINGANKITSNPPSSEVPSGQYAQPEANPDVVVTNVTKEEVPPNNYGEDLKEQGGVKQDIERIIIFYNNGSFKEYSNK